MVLPVGFGGRSQETAEAKDHNKIYTNRLAIKYAESSLHLRQVPFQFCGGSPLSQRRTQCLVFTLRNVAPTIAIRNCDILDVLLLVRTSPYPVTKHTQWDEQLT